MASAALPLVFRPVRIDGAWYSDGGMASPFSPQGRIDKAPLLPLADYDLDLAIVIVSAMRIGRIFRFSAMCRF